MSASATAQLRDRARDVLPGGVLGTASMPDDLAFVAVGGRGSRLLTDDGRELIDYVLGSGPLVLGHRHPEVVAAIQADLDSGPQGYTLNAPAVGLASAIVDAVPDAARVRFATSGSEATMYALRFARAHTGRTHVIKFDGGYHGNHDLVMHGAFPTSGDGCTLASAGVLPQWSDAVTCAVFNDLDSVEAVFLARQGEVAAVLVEPYQRVLAPDPGFLAGLRQLCDAHGALLVFDEVVTGFRLSYGGAQEVFGVRADLATFGKIIGGGLPVSAVTGSAEVLDRADPARKGGDGYVYQSGTLNGQSTACAAGLAVLEVLRRPGSYERLDHVSRRLRDGLRIQVEERGIPAVTVGERGMWHLLFTEEVPRTAADLAAADGAMLRRYHQELVRRGIHVQPGIRSFVSLAHTDSDVDLTLEAAGQALDVVLQNSGQE